MFWCCIGLLSNCLSRMTKEGKGKIPLLPSRQKLFWFYFGFIYFTGKRITDWDSDLSSKAASLPLFARLFDHFCSNNFLGVCCFCTLLTGCYKYLSATRLTSKNPFWHKKFLEWSVLECFLNILFHSQTYFIKIGFIILSVTQFIIFEHKTQTYFFENYLHFSKHFK